MISRRVCDSLIKNGNLVVVIIVERLKIDIRSQCPVWSNRIQQSLYDHIDAAGHGAHGPNAGMDHENILVFDTDSSEIRGK